MMSEKRTLLKGNYDWNVDTRMTQIKMERVHSKSNLTLKQEKLSAVQCFSRNDGRTEVSGGLEHYPVRGNLERGIYEEDSVARGRVDSTCICILLTQLLPNSGPRYAPQIHVVPS